MRLINQRGLEIVFDLIKSLNVGGGKDIKSDN